MGSLAEAMTNLVQHIQAASESRRARLGQLHSDTTGLLGECHAADRKRAAALRETARELHRQMDGAEKARIEAAQNFMRSTRDAIKSIGVRVSELRSDTHNLVQRFTLEHRDMARTLRGNLASETSARVGASHQQMNELRAELLADAQNLHASLRHDNNARQQAVRQTMGELAADIRQASRTWREGLKKKGAPSVAEAVPEAAAAVEEVAQPPLAVEEPAREIPALAVEDLAREVPAGIPIGEEGVEERQVGRAYVEAERVLRVIQDHPEGIRLVEIGNELGVDWRGLIGVVRALVDEGRVEKIDNVYYPAQR